MLTIADLSADALTKIRAYDYDCIIQKHEGPEGWVSILDHYDPEFMQIADSSVLLPISRSQHTNITILRTIVSKDGDSITVFLKDTTFYPEPENELFCTGFMAVCDRMPGEEFFLAIVYHEWFIIDNNKTMT